MPVLRTAFHEVLTLPSLVHLAMENVLFPSMGTFTNLLRPQLKRLAIHNTNLTDSDTRLVPQRVNEEQQCRPEYLELLAMNICSFDRILGGLPILDISHVRTFSVMGHDADLLDGWQMENVMERLRPSLEHIIRFIAFECAPSFLPPLSLCQCVDALSGDVGLAHPRDHARDQGAFGGFVWKERDVFLCARWYASPSRSK
jgi:hypothetical protein